MGVRKTGNWRNFNQVINLLLNKGTSSHNFRHAEIASGGCPKVKGKLISKTDNQPDIFGLNPV